MPSGVATVASVTICSSPAVQWLWISTTSPLTVIGPIFPTLPWRVTRQHHGASTCANCTIADGRSACRDRVHRAVQLRVRETERRQVHPPDRGHRSDSLAWRFGTDDLRRPSLGRIVLGRRPRRWRAARAVSPERAGEDLSRPRGGLARERSRVSLLLHRG